MLKIDFIIFDIDGTLVDAREDIFRAVNFTLRTLGLKERPFDEIVSFIGTGVKDLLRKSLGKDNLNLFDKSMIVFEDYYKKHSADEAKIYPNVVETLEYFKDKTKLIVTNRNREFAKLTLRLMKIDKYFKDIMGGDNENCIKPMACPLNNLLAEFKADKKKTIMVGDMDLDVYAGKNAGVHTCAVTYGIGKKEDIVKAKPDFIIGDLLELRDIVK